MLVKLPQVELASALYVLQGITDKFLSVALPLRLSMTYDQGR
jgi:IS30 family transposase